MITMGMGRYLDFRTTGGMVMKVRTFVLSLSMGETNTRGGSVNGIVPAFLPMNEVDT